MLLEDMEKRSELDHLKSLLAYVDHRGSDVRLELGTVAVIRQDLPYPTCGWQWESVMAYQWTNTGHINLLEFISLLNYVRNKVLNARMHGQRCLHVLDSRVTAGIVAKGRSSSKRLNRVARRLAGYSLAADIYIMPIWTISRWMPCDAGSRLFTPRRNNNEGI